LTGRYPARLGITDWLPGRKSQPRDRLVAPALPTHLALGEVTVAEVLRAAGYRTASIGKWHLGEQPEHFPQHQGFDLNVGGSGKGHPPSFFSPHRLPHFEDGPPGEHLDDRLTREAIAFITAAVEEQRPFFLYLPHYAVHTPLQGKPELVAKYEAKRAALPDDGPDFSEDGPDGRIRIRQSHPVYAAMMENLDTNVGHLVDALERLGVSGNTLVIFTSDNGGLSTAEGSPASNRPLRAGKGWAYEGGVRVPLIVSWPGRLHGGRNSDAIVTSPDFFPTLLELAGLPAAPDQHVDGVSFAAALDDSTTRPAARPIFWHYPHYSNQRGKPHGAVRDGHWKLIEWFEDGRLELFDLATDLSESNDLSAAHPDVARGLLERLRAWRADVGAIMPTPNPHDQAKP
jgi:arylsulfatase A-like enzyme